MSIPEPSVDVLAAIDWGKLRDLDERALDLGVKGPIPCDVWDALWREGLEIVGANTELLEAVWMFRPEAYRAMDEQREATELAAHMAICRACFVTKGPFHDAFNGCERVQRCACEPEEPLWNAFAYNQAAYPCACCAAQMVKSGSKWSAFFCFECQSRVIAYDRAVGQVVIPIGRHSLMNESVLQEENAPRRQKPVRLVEGLVGLLGGMPRLWKYARTHVASIVRTIPEPAGALPVTVYVEHANRMNADRAAAFARLVAAMAAP